MAQSDGIDGFEDALGALEATMSETSAVTSAFSAEMSKMQEAISATSVDAEALSKGLSRGLKSAFDGLVFDGLRASDALEKVARSVINTAYSSAMKPVTKGLGSALSEGLLGLFAYGASFSQGKVMNISTPDAASFQRSQSQIAAQMSRALGRGQRNR